MLEDGTPLALIRIQYLGLNGECQDHLDLHERNTHPQRKGSPVFMSFDTRLSQSYHLWKIIFRNQQHPQSKRAAAPTKGGLPQVLASTDIQQAYMILNFRV